MDKFAKPPHVSKHHQNVISEFLDFHMFSHLPWKSIEAEDYQRCYSYFLKHILKPDFLLLS